MQENITINIASGPGGTVKPAQAGTEYTTSSNTDPNTYYKVRLYGLADCQTDGSGSIGSHDGLYWDHGGDRTFGTTLYEGTRVYLTWNGKVFPYKRYSSNHEYIYRAVKGTGLPWKFRFYDPRFFNNAGNLSVEISEELASDQIDPNEPTNPGFSSCDAYGEEAIGNPISIRKGEKREVITDITINTPAGELALVRSYYQNRQPVLNAIGLGWTHNHLISLDFNSGGANKVIVRLDNGGEAHFTQTSPGVFTAAQGVYSTLVLEPNGQYTYTSITHKVYVFDNTGKLLTLLFPNGESWTYSYNTNGQLTQVEDQAYDLGNGKKRKLVFRYFTSGPHTGKLFRVGDHSFNDTNPNSPTGRYVQYDYLPNKVAVGGVIQDGNESVLVGVRDLRAKWWTYSYYGKNAGETDVRQLNYLVKHKSPTVDRTGDGVADGEITLENMIYTMAGTESSPRVQGIVQQRGDNALNTTYEFQPNGQNITRETIAGKETVHHFRNGVFAGKEAPGMSGKYGEQVLNLKYRPVLQSDANGNPTWLTWSTDGRRLTGIQDANEQLTSFTYDPQERLTKVIDASGGRTEYLYEDSNQPQLPTTIKIFESTQATAPVVSWRVFQYDSKGRVLEEKTLNPSNTVNVLHKTTRNYYTSGNSNGLLYQLTEYDAQNSNLTTSTTYTYDQYGRLVKVRKSSLFGSCKFTYYVYDFAGNLEAVVCSRENVNTPVTPSDAVSMYDSTDPSKSHVTTYIYDALGRRIKTTSNAGSPNARVDLTFYDGLSRVVRTITNYINQSGTSNEAPGLWIWSKDRKRWEKSNTDTTPISHGINQDQNIINDTIYNDRGSVRLQLDPLGNVTLFGYDDIGRLITTIRNAIQESYNNNYSGSNADPRLANYASVNTDVNAGNDISDRDLVSENVYDASGNLVQTIEYLPQNTEKSITESGKISTFYVYDALNRLIRTIKSAKPDARVDLNPGDAGYDVTWDPRIVEGGYVIDQAPDRDLIEDIEYDAMGRVIRTRRLLDKRPNELWETTLFGYDSLGREIKVVRNASDPAYNVLADPTLGSYVASTVADQDILTTTEYDVEGRVKNTTDPVGIKTWYTYDGYDRLLKTIVNPSVANPTVTYTPSTLADKDLITTTEYNSNGMVKRTQDVLGKWTLYGYDLSDRLVRTIQNASNPAYNTSTDGTLANYVRSGMSDEDIITTTVYDTKGRVQETIDTRGNVTRYAYDALDRRTQVIVNYSVGSSDPDRNRTTTTSYDLLGRVTQVVGADGRTTLYLYDKAGRRTRTIVNYVAQGTTQPKDWSWDGSVWKKDATTNVDHGTAKDQNLISDTVYDKAGQVSEVRDPRGSSTQFLYDAAGRQYVTIDPPVLYAGVTTPTATRTYTCFDKAGRVLRVIRNCTATGTVPDSKNTSGVWTFLPSISAHGANNDKDLITEYLYDLASRPVKVIDPLGNEMITSYYKDGQIESVTEPKPEPTVAGMVTKYRYDEVRRRNKVIQGYQPSPGNTDPQQWKWNGAAVPARWEEN